MSILIAYPFLALIVAAVFLALHRASKRRIAATLAIAWTVYAVYEYAMYRRWLCTGECNIRVDLLLIYPALLVGSLAAAYVAGRAIAQRSRAAQGGSSGT